MKQIAENGNDDDDEPRFWNGSMSCLFPMLTNNDSPRKSLSYDKLHQQPLRLAVLKLDGSSFEIEVPKSGTVGELKKAVESAFCHLPSTGPGKVSWEHVWGQFCLCHESQKLLNDKDYISLLSIKDGDQLQFVRHASTTYNLVKIQSDREDYESDDEPCIVDRENKSEKDVEILADNQNDDAGSDENDDENVSRCRHRLANLFKCWFPYRKLRSSSHTAIEDQSSSSPRSIKNCLRHSSNNKHCESQRETGKGK
ncbi:U11/U12 small nuclear ribonucleoprotein 25 kDa protein [Phtheirospermum japonicum]|uniref:U11/U12 small nuclear ribonucleoprotein 25 kDa protein n=1 Tax=Phtheirospermum japonicum TaxID=374723 RepID=A0A830D5F9_9LAMI|nr:U11/U12 small nuclear ribonucleoprotein 25 kDa protein [Phtheirospermum japonicum]